MAATAPLPSPITGIRLRNVRALLGGTPHGERFRAPCPVHGGSNPTALGIAQGRDRAGNPMTLLHCFARDCSVETSAPRWALR